LFGEIHDFEARRGLRGGNIRALKTRQDPSRDLDTDAMRILVPVRTEIASPEVATPVGSSIHLGMSLERLVGPIPESDTALRFTVLIEDPEGIAHEVASEVLRCRGGKEPADPVFFALALPAGVSTGRLVLRTEQDDGGMPEPGPTLLPAWWSPVLEGPGVQANWQDHPLVLESVELDLLQASRQEQGAIRVASVPLVPGARSAEQKALLLASGSSFSVALPAQAQELTLQSSVRPGADHSQAELRLNIEQVGADGAARSLVKWVQSSDDATEQGGWVERRIRVEQSGPQPAALRVSCVLEGAEEAALLRPHLIRRQVLSRQLEEHGPNVVFMVAETLRADELPPYGDADVTPTLHRLARAGRLYHDAQSSSSWTGPSTATLMTGYYPPTHGVESMTTLQLPSSQRTLAEMLARQGITTVGFVANPIVDGGRGYGQGFEHYETIGYARAKVLNRKLDAWLRARPKVRFFAYLHYFEPHLPYDAPGELRERFVPPDLRDRWPTSKVVLKQIKAAMDRGDDAELDRLRRYFIGRYRGEVASLDRGVQHLLELLAAQGREQNTIFVFTADHGEEFADHGQFTHGFHLYREVLHVPLILHGAGIRPAVFQQPVENAGLFATVCELFGVSTWEGLRPPLPTRPSAHGAPLLATLSPGSPEGGEKSKPLAALRAGQYQLITDRSHSLPPELYDLSEDPSQQHNLYGNDAPRDQQLSRQLQGFLEALPVAEDPREGSISAELQEVLEALGYLDE
jgi:arylsulfatase A-like enzyme